MLRKVVIASDKYKGCLDTDKVAAAIGNGIRRVVSECIIVEIPVADGGDGTVKALVTAGDGKMVQVNVKGPFGDEVTASYGISSDGKTAFMEMAAASGMALVDPGRLNPMKATTYGTGQMILHAVGNGIQTIIMGVGGSATVDGGTGMARALGIRLLDESGRELGDGGQILNSIAKVDYSGLDERVKSCDIAVACDVDNPLLGKTGSARVYGPQKGASPEMVGILEDGLANMALRIMEATGRDIKQIPGAGAAGGLAAGLAGFAGAHLENGAKLVLDHTSLASEVKDADLVITGEGAMDYQTAFGKTPAAVASVAHAGSVPCMAIVGSITADAEQPGKLPFEAIVPITDSPMTLEQAIENAPELIERAAMRLARIYMCSRQEC